MWCVGPTRVRETQPARPSGADASRKEIKREAKCDTRHQIKKARREIKEEMKDGLVEVNQAMVSESGWVSDVASCASGSVSSKGPVSAKE